MFQSQAVDEHRPGGPVHLYALAGQLVEPLALHRHRRVHGRHLFNGSPKACQRLLQSLGGNRLVILLHQRTGYVSGVKALAQPEPGHIFLFRVRQQAGGLGCPAQQQGQHAGGHGVQGAGVAGFFLFCQSPRHGHRIERGEAGGFVQNNHAVHDRSSSFISRI